MLRDAADPGTGDPVAVLLAHARAGDTRALESILATTRPVLVRRLRGWIGEGVPDVHDAAEDIAQDALVRLAQRLPACAAKTSGQFIAWSLSIAWSRLADARRARGHELRRGRQSIDDPHVLYEVERTITPAWDADEHADRDTPGREASPGCVPVPVAAARQASGALPHPDRWPGDAGDRSITASERAGTAMGKPVSVALAGPASRASGIERDECRVRTAADRRAITDAVQQLRARLALGTDDPGDDAPALSERVTTLLRVIVAWADRREPAALELVAYRIFLEASWCDVAAEFGTTPAAAKRRFQRATASLRRLAAPVGERTRDRSWAP